MFGLYYVQLAAFRICIHIFGINSLFKFSKIFAIKIASSNFRSRTLNFEINPGRNRQHVSLKSGRTKFRRLNIVCVYHEHLASFDASGV